MSKHKNIVEFYEDKKKGRKVLNKNLYEPKLML